MTVKTTWTCLLIPIVIWMSAAPTRGQERPNVANYDQAKRFASSFLRPFVYGGSIRPRWVGDSDRFWYSARTSEGTEYWLVDPHTRAKAPLFDRHRLAALLTEATRKPRDAGDLKIRNLAVDEKLEKLTFEADNFEFEYVRDTGELTKKEKKKPEVPSAAERARARARRGRSSGEEVEESQEDLDERRDRAFDAAVKRYYERQKKKDDEARRNVGGQPTSRRRASTGSAFSPDLKWYVFAQGHNLYVVERTGDIPPDPELEKKKAEELAAAKRSEGGKANEKGEKTTGIVATKPAEDTAKEGAKKKRAPFPFAAAKGFQLSKDGEEDFGFGGGGKESALAESRSVSWAPDSKAFFTMRRDQRGVAELWLVDSRAEPRPSLRKYKYPMPGEDKIRRSELYVYDNGVKKLIRVKPKWKDEWYSDVRWLENGELRLIRRDRLRRNLEYGIVDPKTGDFTVLISEGFENANQTTQSVRYLEDRGELIWWSERSGWGHYYRYDLDGTLKNPITSGRYRASRIVDVDEEEGVLWFRANGREAGENVYYEHLYRVRLDGTGLKLLDPGNATHSSSLSKSRRFIVDTCSRVDLPYCSVLRDSEGNEIMKLETTDTSRLEEMGWRPPTPFVVKAADGFTDLYGNMWKPFDFDPRKRYPIIVHVYPGPQTEGVTHTFSATGSRQELAQLGFIVIQVGHRGGTPTRSKAYGAYGYFNLRDYGLVDKKAAIEQLAARHPFIDVERVGIYGHSGGGFMTAAALMQKPYNDFFKVGVSSAGNHDNNIYNNSWSERFHGLKEVEVKKRKKKNDKSDDAGKGSKRTEKSGVGKTNNITATKGKAKGAQDKTVGKKDEKDKETESETKFQIKVPTNAELAANLKGRLLLIHGEMDNNVHPAGTMRLVDALIKANKRFDMLIIPGAGHGFGRATDYVKHVTWEYFAQHLLGDHQPRADIHEKSDSPR